MGEEALLVLCRNVGCETDKHWPHMHFSTDVDIHQLADTAELPDNLHQEDIQVQVVHQLDKALVDKHLVGGMLLLQEGTLQGGTVLVACVSEGVGMCLVPRKDKLRVGDFRLDMIQADNVLLLRHVFVPCVHVCVRVLFLFHASCVSSVLSSQPSLPHLQTHLSSSYYYCCCLTNGRRVSSYVLSCACDGVDHHVLDTS